MPRSVNVFASGCALAAATLVGLATARAEVPDRLETEAGPVAVERFATGLVHPWGAAFLPDGRMLVSERPGRLRVVSTDGSVSEPLDGVPEVLAERQGGLFDVALDPGFGENRLVYLAFAEPRDQGSGTSAGRGRLSDDATAIENFEVIFRQQPAKPGAAHYGGRLAFAPDGRLFVTTGERFSFREEAQDPRNHLGTIVRIEPDGSVPPDNPFADGAGGAPEVWSYGHRNVEGAAIQPGTGTFWAGEFGPRGGDEINIPEAGRNYGWPLVSWGRRYSGQDIPDPPTRPEFADAVRYWVPAISPSGMTFYDGELFPDWRGDLFLGGLSSMALVRVDVEGREAVGEERLEMDVRVRHVVEGPEGALYLLTDEADGRILRLVPAD